MSRRYTDFEKNDVLRRLKLNRGDVHRTHLQTQIPQRTLREWKRQYRTTHPDAFKPDQTLNLLGDVSTPNHHSSSLPVGGEALPPASNEIDYTAIRQRFLQAIDTLSHQIASGDTSYPRVLALSHMLDRVGQLNDNLGIETKRSIAIVYKDPDGSIHDEPQWMREYRAEQDDPTHE